MALTSAMQRGKQAGLDESQSKARCDNSRRHSVEGRPFNRSRTWGLDGCKSHHLDQGRSGPSFAQARLEVAPVRALEEGDHGRYPATALTDRLRGADGQVIAV
ncbi:hypothetical protein BO78DRAFT_423619 [Aspergillus sclerotiicarbonarius CBS 121057]|uniref:Uncharacterized protein n=1 Tax=Aspergillus sclerotiicarbonarius (strain CBS 121057 / IBT 28362) TaxID=1448318 RepID=A0A319F7C5_ASPSB|nr:hypothetical protein BO78DRAFT_423619 [Aspergillus sclerotiicarbonarius CBS 121057]